MTLAVDAKTGTVWVGARRHPQVAGSKDELLSFDAAGKALATVAIEGMPMRVAVDGRDSSVWVANSGKAVLRYSADLKEKDTIALDVRTLEIKGKTGNAWVVTPEEILEIDRKGKVLTRMKHKARTKQAWIVSW